MSKENNIRIEVFPQENVSGGSVYTACVRITNLTDSLLSELIVSPSLTAGIEISQKPEAAETEANDLERKKRNLIQDLEKQVHSAYGRNKQSVVA
jgi:hypothetical protein